MSEKYFVKFLNLPDSPQFEIKGGKATIGSQVGDIVVNAPLGPRQCTVTIQKGVFTIVDEGSPDGTFVNGEKIAPGKKVVLQEDDEILFGELGVKFLVRTDTDLNIALAKPGSFEPAETLPPADEGVDMGDLTKIKGLSLESDSDKTSRLSVQILTEEQEKKVAQEKAKMSESKQAKLLEEVKKRKEEADAKKKKKEEDKAKNKEEVPEGVELKKNKKVAKPSFFKQILIALNIIKDVAAIDQGLIQEADNKGIKGAQPKSAEESDTEEDVVILRKNVVKKEVPKIKLSAWQKILVKLKLLTPPSVELEGLEDQDGDGSEQEGSEQGTPGAAGADGNGEAPPPVDEKVIVTVNEEEEVEVEDDSELDGFVSPLNKVKIPVAHGLVRFVAIALDLICSYTFWIVFSEFTLFVKSVNFARLELIKLLTPFENTIKGVLPPSLNYQEVINSNYFTLFAVYIVFRFFSAGFFGVTFGQWLIGIKSNLHSKPLADRPIALWRATLGFIFAPLVIFDLLPLIGRRSLKEILSFTVLFPPKKIRFFIGLFLMLPLFGTMALVSPLFRGLSLVQKVNFAQVKSLPASGVARGEPTFSKYFNVKFANLGPDFVVIPNFTVEHIDSKTMLFPTLNWVMPKAGMEASWKKMGDFDWNHFIELALTGNVVAQTKYPTLFNVKNELATRPAGLKPKVYNFAEEKVWRDELLDLISQVFNLHFDPNFLIQQVKTYGPFWNGLVDARAYFFKHFSHYGNPEVFLLNLGDAAFLRAIPSKEEIPYQEYLISLSLNNPVYYEFTFKGLNDLSYVMSYFYVPLFENAEFFPNQFERPEEVRANDANMIVDEFALVAVKEALSATSAQNIVNYYLDLGRQVMSLANEKLSVLYQDALKNGTQLAAAVGANLPEEHAHKRMVGQMAAMMDSLSSKDNTIWEAGLPPLVDEVTTSSVENVVVEEIMTATPTAPSEVAP